jgi:hypothetical protein
MPERTIYVWEPIETCLLNVNVLIGGGNCWVHINRLQKVSDYYPPLLPGLGDEQQPTKWMYLPDNPE